MNKEAIMENIEKTFLEEKNSHAFLFETNNIEKCYLDILNLIKKITKHENDALIDNENHPDIIHIIPDGKEIKVMQIENIIETFSTTSVMGGYSIYIINEAEKMNQSSANKLLKFLEEPEKNIIGFFITNNINKIIPTIKSRCETFKLRYKANTIQELLDLNDEKYNLFEETLDLVFKMNTKKKYILMNTMKQIAKKDRNEIEIILDIFKKIYIIKYEFLTKKTEIDKELIEKILVSIETNDIMILSKRINILTKMQNEFKYNLNKELLLNKLVLLWE